MLNIICGSKKLDILMLPPNNKDMPKKEDKDKIAIIGGGLTGLTVAYILSKRGYCVRLFESEARIGGMIKGVREFSNPGDSVSAGSDFRNYDPNGRDSSKTVTVGSVSDSFDPGYTDDIYHHLFTGDNYLLQLLEDLDLKSRLHWETAANALMYENRFYPFSTPLDLLSFKPIPFSQRLRTGISVLKASRLKNWQTLENKLASDWIKKNCGEKAWQILWRPLLHSKFGTDAADISSVWIWNKFKLRGSSRKGSKEKLGYIEGGFQQIADRLEAKITAYGGQINTCSQVTEILPYESLSKKTQFKIKTGDEIYPLFFDQIICTIAAKPFLELASDLIDSVEYLEKLSDIEYKANLCLSVIYEKPLSPWYWTTICDDLPFVVTVAQDNLSQSSLKDGHLVYLSRYIGTEEALWRESDQEITDKFIQAAAAAFPGAADNKVLFSRLVRTRYSQPVIKRRYSEKMPTIKTPVSGLWLAGMAQIYPEDRGMNYAVRLAKEVAAAAVGVEK